jgi:lysophospholipase L1-like esterase
MLASLTIGADDPRVHVVGHVARTAAGVELVWSLSEVRVRFTGTSVALDIDERFAGLDGDRFAVFVNGRRTDVAPQKGASRLVLAHDLPLGAHELRFVKRTEPSVGITLVKSVTIDDGAQLLAPRERPRKLEVLGDSIATAFGVLGKRADCPFSPETQDATRGFAGLLADRLRADVAVVAWSGRGIYQDGGGSRETETVPQLWHSAPALEGRTPEVVVIELGSNDFWANAPDRAGFFAAAHALLEDLRVRDPSSVIVLVTPRLTGTEHDANAKKGRAWLREIAAERRHPMASVVDFPDTRADDGMGCMWHPSARLQERYADAIESVVRARMNWRD